MTFEQLNISAPILKALQDKGYETPTPIQEKAIPQILNKRDVLGSARTGTGKTAAFAIPIIQVIDEVVAQNAKADYIRALIITPTRELAIQIDENISDYNKYTKLKHSVIFGGVKQGKQVDRLERGIHILTATPGRLLDLIGQGHISLDKISLFVLDEADRMLDMGFINDFKKILGYLPKQRQSLFFSATMPQSIVQLSSTILNNPVKIEVTPPSTTAETVEQKVYFTNKSDKQDLLLHLIDKHAMEQVLVFTRTKHGADKVTKMLNFKHISAAAIHGNKAQPHRQKALNMFKDGALKVLVATDIAARGIDIEKLQWVINYEVPNEPETYVHRIGRSGRAGETGTAISISEPEENQYMKDIEKLIGLKVPVGQDNPYPQTDSVMTAQEKKEFEKEKQRRKQEFFTNRNAAKGGGQRGPKQKNQGDGRGEKIKKDRHKNFKSDKPSEVKASTTAFGQPSPEKKAIDTNAAPKKKWNNNKQASNKRYTSTDMSDNLRSKFMFPIEK